MSGFGITLSGEQIVETLIDVMIDLSEVLQEENDLLRRGMPAALTNLAGRKDELAREYAHLWKLASSDAAAILAIANRPDWRARILDVSEEFKTVSAENMARLDAAMSATRRRIEAVMSAIRRRDRDGRNYRRDGTVLVRRIQPGRTSCSA